MRNQINEYLKNVKSLYKSCIATEHSFRIYLEELNENVVPVVKPINEPKRDYRLSNLVDMKNLNHWVC